MPHMHRRWATATPWLGAGDYLEKKEEGGRARALHEFFFRENPRVGQGVADHVRALRQQAKLRIVSALIGQLKAEAMPTCRGCVPIRNFASPTSSTSNLASLDKTPGSGSAPCCQPTQ